MARTREFDETEVLDKAVELFWTKGYNATSANDLVNDNEIARIVNENGQNIENTFKVAIERGQELGQIPKTHDAESLARFIHNNISGLRVAVKSNAEKKALDDIVKICLSVLK